MNTVSRHLSLALTRLALGASSRLAPKATGEYLARRFVTPGPQGRRRAADLLLAANSVRRGEIVVDGDRLTTYQWGDPGNEPFVWLSHGWASYALRFAGWVPRLRAMGYAVLAVDQRAHGLSEGQMSSFPDFAHTLRAIGRRFGRAEAFIGHSLGASAIAFAEEPDWRPDRFVLIAPLSVPKDSALRNFRALNISMRAYDPFESWLHDLTGEWFENFNASRRVPHIDRPALVIHDRQDRETPWDDGALYARLWPGAQLLSTDGLGHNRLLDDASVIDAALTFVGKRTPEVAA